MHLKNLKPLPAADPVVDKCMECGFCERMCPSQGMTFTPRHRIIGWREISRLRAVGDEAGAAAMSASYDYQGLETCGLSGTALCEPDHIRPGRKVLSSLKVDRHAQIGRLRGFFMRTSASRQDRGNDQPFRTVATWLAIWAVLLFLLNI